MRIVVLDACRNNPFPDLNDAVRGLAIVDAPNGSIVGYSTAPGSEAQDGDGGHSPYTQAFLHLAREPNLPIEQLFKRVRLEVNNSTDGEQTPWESSSLTRAPDRSPIIQTASNLPSRSVRQAYDYVLSEGSPEHYQEFIELFPHVRSHPRAAQKPGAGASVAQGGACELARCLQELLRQLRQQPVCSSCVEIAVAAEERAGDAVHPSHEAAAARPDVQADEYRFVEGQSRHQAGWRRAGSGDPAGGLRDKLQNGNLDGKNVGKIVTLPATTVGKAGSNQDLKANGFPNRIVRRDTSAIKLNTNPSQGGRPQGNSLTGKIGGGNANCALRRTSSLVGYQRQYFQVGRSNGPGV
jgi:hypothetical protein